MVAGSLLTHGSSLLDDDLEAQLMKAEGEAWSASFESVASPATPARPEIDFVEVIDISSDEEEEEDVQPVPAPGVAVAARPLRVS